MCVQRSWPWGTRCAAGPWGVSYLSVYRCRLFRYIFWCGICSHGQTTDSVSKMFVFQKELCLYCAVLTASCQVAANFASFLHIPANVFMCLDALSTMLFVHLVAIVLVFTLRRKYTGGVFTDSVAAEASQGFAVVSSLLWLGLLSGVYLRHLQAGIWEPSIILLA